MKKVWIIIGAVVVAAALGAGSFAGGMAYQRNQANRIRENFLSSRGLGNNPGANGAQGRSFFGGGATGQVKSIQGNVLTLSTSQNVITVNLSANTRILKTTEATTQDLQTGAQVMVTGQRDNNGNINATQVLILNINPPSNPGPAQGGTATP